jgi:hypothetical protein
MPLLSLIARKLSASEFSDSLDPKATSDQWAKLPDLLHIICAN